MSKNSGILPRYSGSDSREFESLKNIQTHDPGLMSENPMTRALYS